MTPYGPVAIYLAVALAAALLFTVLPGLLARRKPNAVKSEAYECGVEPTSDVSGRFPVRFYLIAMLFVVFDVEAASFFPWAVKLRQLGAFGLVEMVTFIVVLGIAWSALAIGIVIPHFNHGAGSSFYGRYGEVGGSPGGIVHTALHHPGRIVSKLAGARGLHYLGQLGLPLAGLFLAAPLVLVAAVPELALNLLSSTRTQTSIHFHYTAGAIPGLIVASVLGAAALARRYPALPVAAAAVAVALIANWKIGAVPFWGDVPRGEDYQRNDWRVTAHDHIAERAVKLVPPHAVVSATNVLGAHLSARRRVLSLPKLGDATWVVADETRSSYADRVAPLPSAAALARLRRNPDWKLVFERDGVLVFHRLRAG